MTISAADFAKGTVKPVTKKSGFVSAADFANGTTQTKAPGGMVSAADFAKTLPPPEPTFTQKIVEPFKGLATLYGDGEGGLRNKLKEDVQAGAKDIEQGKVIKGVAKTALRTAGDVVGTVFAPIGAIIGAALSVTGGQKAVDYVGQKTAELSGITDNPAFQKFAMEHPNAGEDFERALNLIMASAEKGKIEPKTMVERTMNQVFPKAPPVVRKLVVDSVSESTKIETRTPGLRKITPESVGGETRPVINERFYPQELPTIEFGKTAKETMPTIQLEPKPSLPRGTKLEPIKQEAVIPEVKTPALKAMPKEVVSTEQPRTVPEVAGKKDSPLGMVPEKPVLNTVDPEIVNRTVKDLNNTNAELGRDTEFSRQHNQQQVEQVMQSDIQTIKDVAFGRRPSPTSAPATAYLSTLKNIADDMASKGDTRLSLELSKSNVDRVAGQTLQATQIASRGNLTDVLRDIRIKMEDAMPRHQVKLRQQYLEKINADIKAAMDRIGSIKPTREMILKVLDDITCK